MSDYYVSSEEEENWRLEQMSKVFRLYMGGKPLLAPIDLTRSNLRVLDSACSNGYWLTQLRPLLQDADSCTLIGTDVQDRFPSPPPEGVALQIQDITKPWPEEWSRSFDYVHQTLVLTMAGPRQREVVGALLDLVRPGGWVELMEPEGEVAEDDGVAQKQFVAMIDELWSMMHTPLKFARDLEAHVKAAEFVDVQSRALPTGMGKKVPDPEMREVSIRSMVLSGKSIVGAGKRIPGGFKCISQADLETWLVRWEEELRRQGASYPMRVVYGRRPEAG